MKKLLFTTFWLLGLWCAQAQQKAINQPLADSLAKWAELDQTAAGPRLGRVKDMNDTERANYSDSVFASNERRLQNVFDRYGFPGYALVGKMGSNHFWLMTQHCDHDVAFQEKILAAMQVHVARQNADAKNFAYLTDRVRINTGRKQLYGTQVTYNLNSCQATPKRLADSLTVNKRRKEIGLEPIEAYLNWMSKIHFEMNKAVYEKKGIHQPKLIPEPN
ncbi:MAG: DUF6624 domain-containing protein [Mucilaginibacter sp.]|uniref:DUF6624 domain-containing protein n=1 Tax=Mucilaginibacter sp. TaxID=1882438 RepID=UPI0032644400